MYDLEHYTEIDDMYRKNLKRKLDGIYHHISFDDAAWNKHSIKLLCGRTQKKMKTIIAY